MDFDKISQFLDEFDPASLIPDLESLLDKLDLILRVAVLAAPLVLLVMGLIYFLLPPREANHSLGYRFFWGMASVEAWRFMQWVAGMVFGLLGIGLTIAMFIISGDFVGMESMDMVWLAVKCIFWEMGLVAAACLIIDLTVIIFFNGKGYRRPFTIRKKKEKTVSK